MNNDSINFYLNNSTKSNASPLAKENGDLLSEAEGLDQLLPPLEWCPSNPLVRAYSDLSVLSDEGAHFVPFGEGHGADLSSIVHKSEHHLEEMNVDDEVSSNSSSDTLDDDIDTILNETERNQRMDNELNECVNDSQQQSLLFNEPALDAMSDISLNHHHNNNNNNFEQSQIETQKDKEQDAESVQSALELEYDVNAEIYVPSQCYSHSHNNKSTQINTTQHDTEKNAVNAASSLRAEAAPFIPVATALPTLDANVDMNEVQIIPVPIMTLVPVNPIMAPQQIHCPQFAYHQHQYQQHATTQPVQPSFFVFFQ